MGFTGIFAKENGGGFLTEHFPVAQKAIWDLQGIYTVSRHTRCDLLEFPIQDLSAALPRMTYLLRGTSERPS